MKKLTVIFTALVLLFSLCGCKSDDGNITPDSPTVTYDLPENTLPTVTEETDTEPTTQETTQASEVTTLPTSEITSEAATEETYQSESEDEVVVWEYDLDCRAGDILKLLNSDKVHTKFVEATTFDGEHLSGSTIEYYVDGENMVFIQEDMKIVIDGNIQAMYDLRDSTVYVENYESSENMVVFGYEPYAYTFLYEEEHEDCIAEVLAVDLYGNEITSTWYFYHDGRISVREGNDDVGFFTAYDFEFINDDLSGMDMSAPEGF